MSAKDSLARGARTATFLGGTPEVDAPIVFNKTLSDEPREEIQVNDRRPVFDDSPVVQVPKKNYQPMNDRVLLRRVVEQSDKLVKIAEQYQQKSNKGVVLAVGQGMLIGGQLVAIDLKPGDVVLFGEYNAETIMLDGEEFVLISAYDVRLKEI